jgi:hypothetical protein
MTRRTQVVLVVVGLLAGGLVAYRVWTSRPAPPAALPTPPPPLTTPAERQPRDRFVDEKYGFTIAAAPGWYNETSGLLRKQFAGARGVLVKQGSGNQVFLQIAAAPLRPDEKPDPAQFLARLRRAFASSAAVTVRGAEVTKLAGAPAVSLVTETSGVVGKNVIRHLWVFGTGVQVHLTLSDMRGTYARNQADFARMLKSFAWTPTQARPPAAPASKPGP